MAIARYCKFFLGLLICIFIVSVCAAQRVVVLTDSTKEVYLSKDYLSIAEDTTGSSWTIDTVSSSSFKQFVVNHDSYRYVENSHSSYWIKIIVKDSSSFLQKWVFEVLSLHTNELHFYYRKQDGSFYQSSTGEKKTFNEREYKVKNFVFDLPVSANEAKEIYIQVKSTNDAGFEYKIRSQKYFTWYATHEYMFLGIYYGLLTFLILYNLVLFITSRDRLYLYYSLYLLACCAVSFTEDGLCFEFLWPNAPALNAVVESYGELFYLVFFIMYAVGFISMRKNYPYFFATICAITALYILIFLMLPSWYEIAYLYVYWLPFALVYAIAFYSYIKGYKAARYLLIGYSLVLISILMSRLRWYGIIEANIITVYSFYFAVVLEAFVFSFAIADRLSLLKKDKEKADKVLIQQLEENKQLQTKVNRELEQKVAERTAELQTEKEKLDLANQKLEQMALELNKMNSKLDYDNWHLQKDLKEEKRSRILFEKVTFEEYQKIFPTDFSCYKYLEKVKWGETYKCKKCANAKYTDQKDELLSRRCTRCGYIESVMTHTLFQSVKFPLTKAFYIVYTCSLESEKITLDELSELLQLRRNTCWSFRKKVLERIEVVKQKHKVNTIKNWEILIQD